MIDKILHAVTNRRDFVSPCFTAASSFTPVAQTAAAAKVSALLCLDYNLNDYYVQAALATIDAYPEIREAFRESDRSYSLRDFQRPKDAWGGVLPVPDLHGPFIAARRPHTFPVSFDVQFSYLDPDRLGVTADGQTQALPCSLGGDILYPEWPVDMGIHGGLQLSGQTWDSTFKASMLHMPTSFPFVAVAALLEEDPNKNELLLSAGLIEHYASARVASEKYATVLLALGLSNLQSWP